MIPRETIDKVFAAAKIEEVVSDYVTLKKRGANLIGLCPFHHEKTGSFTVSPSKGIYKCFGCGKSGHAVGFVMEIEQCGFADAVKQIAKKYHIEVQEREMTPEEQQRQDDRESMFVVNEFANKWFQEQLWNTEEGKAIGLSYFRERGLREDTIKKFQLGYSPEKGSSLAKVLKSNGFLEKYVVNDVDTRIGTGVCGKSEDGRVYDRFRDRVIFPIHSVSGKTVGFAGRILKKNDKVGKYVNSPDSLIYSKTNELYGLFLAKQAISREDLCYLVEGQMDLISMYQAGIENVVASGGTALTKPQIRLIRRFTPNITVIYDGDPAGIHAALRGIDMFLEEGFNVKVVLLPDGEDPDSFANSHNASDFIEYIKQNQTDFIHYKATTLMNDVHGDPQKFSVALSDVLQSIAKVPNPIQREEYVRDTSRVFKREEKLLSNEVEDFRLHSEHKISEDTIKTNEEKSQEILDQNFQNLLQLIVRYGERPLYQMPDGTFICTGAYIISQLQEEGVKAPNKLYQNIIDEFMVHCEEPDFIAEKFFKFYPDESISKLAVELIADKYQLSQIFSKQSISENVVQNINLQTDADHLPELTQRLLLELKYTIVNQRIDQLEQMMKEADANGDHNLVMQLLASQPQLLSVKNAISKQLGNRVITL